MEEVAKVEEEDMKSLINVFWLVVGLRCWIKEGELL